MSLSISGNPDGTITISCGGQSATIGAPSAPGSAAGGSVGSPEPLPLPEPIIFKFAVPTKMEISKRTFLADMKSTDMAGIAPTILSTQTPAANVPINFGDLLKDWQDKLSADESFVVTLRTGKDG